MGWVSMIEDNIEAITSDFERVKGTLDATVLDQNIGLHLESLVKTCEILLRNLCGCLDLALNKNLDTANEIIEVRRKNGALTKEVQAIKEKSNALALELREVKKEKRQLASQLKQLSVEQRINRAGNSQMTSCEICSASVRAGNYERHKKKVHGPTINQFDRQSDIRIGAANSNKGIAKIVKPSFNGIRIIPLNIKK